MKTPVKQQLKLYSKRLVVISAITLTLAPLAVRGRQGGLNAQADTTSSGNNSKGLAVKTDQSALNTAIEKAKAAGVNVTQQATKEQVVSSNDAASAKTNIASDYANQVKQINAATTAQNEQMATYNAAVAKYQAALAAWQDYMKKPTYTNSTQWSNKTLDDFMGDNPADVTYISNSTKKMALDYGNVSKVTAAQYSEIEKNYKGGLTLNGIDETNGTWVVLKVGSKFTYQEPFVDSQTGKTVDVKYTVNSIDNQQTPAYAWLSKKEMGINLLTPNMKANYTVQFVDHASGKPVTLKEALIGFGDIDATQAIKFDQDAAKTLVGDKVTKVSDNEYQAKDETAYPDSETGTQIWRRMDKIGEFSYTWSQGKNFWSAPRQSDDFHALGNISFGLLLKTRPQDTTPPKPEAKAVNYQLTDLLVTPTNHKDVEMGSNTDKDTASINGKTVDKGDTLTYPITNSDLPADRTQDITSYVITDPVQKELTINQDAVKSANSKNWDVKVNGQTITYTANAALLKAMNADKSKAYAVPEAKLIGTVNADDVTIKNQVNTKINDVTVDSNVPENKVEKLSPSLIAKRVEDVDGKLVTTNVNTNILTGKDVYFDIFNQYDNNSHTDDLEDTDSLPKDAKVDTSKVKVMMSDGKADINSMTADKLTGLTYSKDVTADVDITYKDGKLIVKPKAGKEDEFKSQQTKVRFAANLPAKNADDQLTKKDGNYVWNNQAKKGDVTSNEVNYNSEKDPDLIDKKVETSDGKFADSVENANIINDKQVAFDIFNQYNNLGETTYMTNADPLPKDAQVDLDNVKVYLADDETPASDQSDNKADDESSMTASDQSDSKAEDESSTTTSDQSDSKASDGATTKVDAKTMTSDKLSKLTYSKDVTADFTVKYENGKLTTTPKPDKVAEYAGKQTKTRFMVSLGTDKIDDELTKKGNTYTWNNQASNGKDETTKVDYHADKTIPKPETPKEETKKEESTPTQSVTKYVKMAQTGHKLTWLDRLFSWLQ